MSKRLKRKIQEVSGLDKLKREEQVKQAQAILEDSEAKQAICHKVLGASHKDVERALKSIIQDKKPTKAEHDESELKEIAPEKFHPERQREKARPHGLDAYSSGVELLLDPEEVNALIQESSTSKAIQEEVEPMMPGTYPTYSFEEVAALMACDYHPDHFKWVKNERS